MSLKRATSVFGLVALGLSTSGGPAALAADSGNPTASPIKHVIIIVGENRSFDHLFATYVPKNGERVRNLLSEGIINADGSQGTNFARARQFQITAPPNGSGNFFMSAGASSKSPYLVLPTPDVNGVQNPPAAALLSLTPPGDPGLPASAQFLLGTGGTGLPYKEGPDTRITNVTTLSPGPFQLTGPTMPYDAYAGDTVHQYFQMVQQVDCAIDGEHVSKGNPTGCLHDLQSGIDTTYATSPLTTPPQVPRDTAQTMEFFNMQNGDVPLFKSLADQYTISDNYHQPVMGGTGPDSVPLGFADQVYFSDGLADGAPALPPASTIYNPNPNTAAYPFNNFNLYTHRAQWFNCSDANQPGVGPILAYLGKLPYTVDPKCASGHYYNAVNVNPAWTPQGTPTPGATGLVIPAQSQRSIGDVLTAHNIPWKYYGGSYNASGGGGPFDGLYCNICNPFEYQLAYPSMRADHMRDVLDLFTDIQEGTLAAVSYVKPDGVMDGHPASSKFNLFEAFAGNIITMVQADKKLWNETAIFVTVDEGGGFYDSGFIQWVDFFGTGPRIPMIAVSPFSTGGHVSHVYNEHSSFVKFVERNWKLSEKLTARSRDNLPNPVHNNNNDADDYVPSNMPAIGDLFDLFQFGNQGQNNQGQNNQGQNNQGQNNQGQGQN
jgi:phospholipase C